MPNALMEAMVQGVPVAATPVGDVPLLLADGQAGWLVSVGDIGAWGELLRRLEAKGYVTHVAEGRAHVFSPAADRQEVIRRTVGDFVDRLFGGDPVPLMLHLADSSKLSADEIKRLKELLDKWDV